MQKFKTEGFGKGDKNRLKGKELERFRKSWLRIFGKQKKCNGKYKSYKCKKETK